MGFIKAALSAGISSFQDSKFKEAITCQKLFQQQLWPLRDSS